MVAETEKRKGMMTAAAFAAATASIKNGLLWEECYMFSESSSAFASRQNQVEELAMQGSAKQFLEGQNHVYIQQR